jgi:CheY-like chemotaxis protein
MKKVLIIEDNREIRENTAELLELNNYSVLVAENGRIGFDLAKRSIPDIILCDMMMPETNGWEFFKLAKEEYSICNIPIIFFSAGSFIPEVEKSLIKGANGYLQKPFTEAELLKNIERGLDGKEYEHLSLNSR